MNERRRAQRRARLLHLLEVARLKLAATQRGGYATDRAFRAVQTRRGRIVKQLERLLKEESHASE